MSRICEHEIIIDSILIQEVIKYINQFSYSTVSTRASNGKFFLRDPCINFAVVMFFIVKFYEFYVTIIILLSRFGVQFRKFSYIIKQFLPTLI